LSHGKETQPNLAQLRVSLRCDLGEVRPKLERVRKFLLKAGCEESRVLECELALVEACTNAIQHASPDGKDQSIVIDANVADGKAEFRITDHTAGFDWPKQPSLPDGSSERGRGVFLIQSLMDSVRYVRAPEGNVLILRKAL
jgi:serine/threonine-protein kinase RsbW